MAEKTDELLVKQTAQNFAANLMTHSTEQTKERLQVLAAFIGSREPRDWCGPYDPQVGDDPLRFYSYCLVQQCGAGLVTEQDTLSCGNLWNLFVANWRGARDIFGPVSFQRFCDFIQPEDADWQISPGRLFTRYLMHQDIASCGGELARVATCAALSADPFKKRLNLLLNTLSIRPEKLVAGEGGPVIDYHVMRVFLRFLDLPLTGDALADEAELRQAAWFCAWHLHDVFGLSHDQSDFFLWLLGRTICTYDEPLCYKCPLTLVCAKAQKREPRVETFFY